MVCVRGIEIPTSMCFAVQSLKVLYLISEVIVLVLAALSHLRTVFPVIKLDSTALSGCVRSQSRL